MAYSIQVSPLARKDIIETGDYIRDKIDQERATRWKNELLKAIGSLSEMPKRCPVADESRDVGLELRELHHKPHRIIFTIDEPAQAVQILRVYHSARAPLKLEDLL
jgi:plasmid stabilization system protein ParE